MGRVLGSRTKIGWLSFLSGLKALLSWVVGADRRLKSDNWSLFGFSKFLPEAVIGGGWLVCVIGWTVEIGTAPAVEDLSLPPCVSVAGYFSYLLPRKIDHNASSHGLQHINCLVSTRTNIGKPLVATAFNAGCTGVPFAEALALRNSLICAKEKDFTKIDDEGDSKLVIDAVNQVSAPPWRLLSLLQDIKLL
ncbi:hypothetical protein ACLB2K_019573 [Fragaria x ananassa]